MFNKSRPVPSTAALRILYQLAYISSGTAVGVAALCAEERRRRTHYVQKIADNAKRLRQSPRHVHNVAAATKSNEHATGVDSGHGGEFGRKRSEEDYFERFEGRDERKGKHEAGERLVRGSELPSAVEKGYAQVTRDHKRARQRGPEGEAPKQSGADERRPPRELTSTARYQPLSMKHAGTKSNRLEPPKSAAPPLKISKIIRPQVSNSPPRFRLKEAAALDQYARAETNCEPASDRDAVVHDVGLFLQSTPWTSSKLKDETRVADCLLREAVRQNCLGAVRQLVSWKLANHRLEKEDVNLLVEAYSTPNVGMNKLRDVFELFAELFGSKAFRRFPKDWKFSIAIPVAVNTLSWDIGLKDPEIARFLLQEMLLSFSHGIVEVAVNELCDKLLAAGHVQRAFDTVQVVRHSHGLNRTKELNRRWKHVYSKIMDYSMEHDQLWICQKYILLLMIAGQDPDRIVMLEWLLRECCRRKTCAPLKKLLKYLILPELWKVLSDQAKVDLAIALTVLQEEDTQVLEDLCREIPKPLLGPVMEAWCAGRMHWVWRTRKDLPAVWKEYERAKTLQLERFGAAELALIEICNKANQAHEALNLLANTLQNDSQNPLALCMAAVSLARISAWKQLHGLVTMIAKSGKFINDESTSRNLNNVIALYAHRHAAAETWKFVVDMITSFGFAPNRATTKIMLQTFVIKQTPNLIPRWTRYLKTIGSDFHMSSRVATKLMSCFYYSQRPPHALLMWLSRNLSNKWPSFYPTGLKEVIKASIGHDLRNLPVQNKPWLRERAKNNLARLADSDGEIPKPYRSSDEIEAGSWEFDPDVPARPDEMITRSYNSQPLVKHDSQNGEVQHTPQRELPDVDFVHEPAASQDENSPILHDIAPRAVPTSTNYFANLPLNYCATAEAPVEGKNNEDMTQIVLEDSSQSIGNKCQKTIVREMILALSLRDYHQVLHLYDASLSPTGLPASLLALEVATEASIRLCKGDIRQASAMLDAAKLAGMDVRRAMGPLLIHRMRSLDDADQKDANSLRLMVIDYYRTNEENGFPVEHHVGVTAANILINNRRPEHGINILNSIYNSEWALERPMGIVAMTVYLKGYSALKSQNGIVFVLKRVLDENMPIDRPFLLALKDACRSFGICTSVRRTRMRLDRSSFVSLLRAGRQRCILRRAEQRHKTKVFGNLLVKRILSCVEMERMATVDVDSKPEPQETLLGKHGVSEGDLEEERGLASAGLPTKTPAAYAGATEHEATGKSSRLEARRQKAHIARAKSRTREQICNAQWLRRYRSFVKKDVVMADGKRASSRRYVW